jgi:hypothetical protein
VQVFIDCNNIWVSLRQGAHHDAQKSTIVTFPKLSLRETTFPSGLGAAKSEVHLSSPTGAAVAPTAELISVSFVLRIFPLSFFFKTHLGR